MILERESRKLGNFGWGDGGPEQKEHGEHAEAGREKERELPAASSQSGRRSTSREAPEWLGCMTGEQPQANGWLVATTQRPPQSLRAESWARIGESMQRVGQGDHLMHTSLHHPDQYCGRALGAELLDPSFPCRSIRPNNDAVLGRYLCLCLVLKRAPRSPSMESRLTRPSSWRRVCEKLAAALLSRPAFCRGIVSPVHPASVRGQVWMISLRTPLTNGRHRRTSKCSVAACDK
ncbi:hypothetical protein VTI74DRAFT_4608 [Chaetomium olivicolor]